MAPTAQLDDLNILKPSDAANALELCIRAKQPVLLRGEAGIGKSDIVLQTADRMGLACIDIRTAQLDPVDLRGLPRLIGERTVWAPPEFLPRDGAGILFFDELNRAPSLVQNAALQIFRDRRLGEWTMPDGWTCVAAINPEGSTAGTGTTRMSQALSNRFTHVTVEADPDDWCKWAIGAGIEPVVIAFIRFRPQLLHQPTRDAYAFPTPRSWSFVSRIVGQKPTDAVELALVSGSVGHGAAVEFLAFLRTWRTLPSIDAILLNPVGAPVPADVATQYAVASALATRAKDDNLGRVLQYLDRLPAEYSVFAVKDAVTRDASLTSTPEFTNWAVSHSHLM